MIFANVLEYGLVLLILAVCVAFVWRRFMRTVRGESTSCCCKNSTCARGARGARSGGGAPSCPSDKRPETEN